jgi:hypothetical protein
MTFCNTHKGLTSHFYSIKSKKENRISKIIFLLIFLIGVYFTCYPQKKHPEPKGNKDTLEQVKSFSGQLLGWAVNNDYVYGGFYLQVACTKYLVVFYPNMGRKLRRKLNANAIISINGAEITSATDTVKAIKLVSVKEEDIDIHNTPSNSIIKKTVGKSIKGSSRVNEVQKDKQGKVIGFVLDNQIILRMPLAYLETMEKVAPVGTTISYHGEKQKLPCGETAQMDYTVVYCNNMTISGKEYLTR